ncbi:hypothetical protein ACHAWT_003069 [Skeletonema menzelii]
MKKRRGTTTAAVTAALLIGGGGAAIALNSIVSTETSTSLYFSSAVEAAAASSPSASIRGGNSNDRRLLLSKNERLENQHRRPAILDSHQSDKIQQWKEDQQQRQDTNSDRLLMSNIDNGGSSQKTQIKSKKKALGSVLPHVTSSGKRRLYEYMTLNHKKESGGVSHISKLDEDKFHFQTQPTTTSSTTTTTSTTAAASIVANSQETSYQQPQSSDYFAPSPLQNNNYYYPISTPDHSVGTCTNNGNEPDHYSLSNGFLYTTLEECCQEWFVRADECTVGFATTNGDDEGELLMVRDPFTGVLLSEMTTTSVITASSLGNAGSVSSNVFYPSFDMAAYPDGACINDGNQPDIYNTSEGYTFDSIEVCCHEWFIDESGCKQTSLQVTTMSSSGSDEPVPSPAGEETDYPTWSSEFDYDDDDTTTTAATVLQEEMSSVTSNQEEETLSFYDSFETGDFSHYWTLTSSSPTADLWEADQSAWAYDGIYAARPGVLSEPNSQSNLTISLEDVHSIRHGGYLTFAIHASVSQPVDVLTFLINDNVIRTFEQVTGDEGEWEEVSILLHAGEHRLTWSYQYYGGMTSSVDPRRAGNSWIDAIKLRPFTGDFTIGDDDDTTLALTNGMAPFELLPDINAFVGSKSFVARTEAIDALQGSAEMSWEVYIGPDGGVISFAAFASLYAPHDVCEFSIDGVPQVIIATFSDEWETHQVFVDAGKHELTWKLVKNFAGLDKSIIDDADVPSDYQGYVKLDGINLEDNSITHVVDEEVIIANAGEVEVTDTMPATTSVAPTTTSEPITTKATTTSTTTEKTTTVAPTIEFVECPGDMFSVEGLPGCCVEEPSYLGDGACDPRAPYNTEACAFDLGDCCRETCNPDSAYGCKTKEGGDFGPFGFFCIDPRFGNIDEKRCQVENLEWIGDGGCDVGGGYNTPECGWDGGDCCEETCDNEYSFYPCGANQAYDCRDPSVANKESTSDSPFSFQDGFESGVIDPLRWDVDDGDAKWKIDDSKAAAGGDYYIAARSEDISPEYGTARLKHVIESMGGGVLSFDIQALVQIPFDDVIIMIDDDIVAEFSSSSAGWERKALDISTGPHLVQWIHRKNPSNMPEADLTLFGYPDEGVTMIDNIAFQPSK